MKIGIFGGSFNPPHHMHKKIGDYFIQNGYLDKVIYVPTGNKYQKKDLIDAKYRYQMLLLMVKDYPCLEVSDYELKSQLTYTYQTLDYFKKLYPNDEIYFICGADNLKEIMTWKNYEYILNNYKLLVIHRNNDLKNILKQIRTDNIIFSNLEQSTLSSTIIRNAISSKNWNILKELDERVAIYIIENGLYSKNKL